MKDFQKHLLLLLLLQCLLNVLSDHAYQNIKMKEYRRRIMRKNQADIFHLNLWSRKTDSSSKFGMTRFTRLTPQEFRSRYLCSDRIKSRTKRAVLEPSGHDGFSPKQPIIDWRKNHAVTAVKNQMQCGGCWAFSVVEGLESMNKVKNNVLEELSVQQVINCAHDENKCSGGDICHTADWLSVTMTKITTETKYPLTDQSGPCNIHPKTGVQLENYMCHSYVGAEEKMLELLEIGPLSVSVDAALWQNYLGGIIQHHCETNLNHAVQIVGYNLTGPVPYYIVRNSWGSIFGHDGYLYIKYGSNMCGIAEEVLSMQVY